MSDPMIAQYPYGETDEWVVAEATLDCGISTTLVQHSNLMRRFSLHYETITRAELTILEDFFNLCRGPYQEFEFTDDQGFTWEHTRFDMDRLQVKYPEVGRFSTEIQLSAQMATATGGDGAGSSL
jgi:hypothetical protein